MCIDTERKTNGDKVMKANEAPGTYPMQFRDKIDEYLWKEHHIIGGCCSSIESLKYSVAREVAEKLTDAFIEKACFYIKNTVLDITYSDVDGKDNYNIDEFIEDFEEYLKK